MMMKINFALNYFALVLMVVLTCSCNTTKADKPQPAIFAAGGGFGYTISMHNKILIKQATIPAMAGDVVFCDSLDALKVGNLVAKKISKKQSPTITKQDLAQLKIKTKC